MEIECIQNEERFLDLRSEWDDLWRRSMTPSFFLSHGWVHCCWRELREDSEMRIFVVRDGNRPLLIAPLTKVRKVQMGFPVCHFTMFEHPEAQLADLIIENSDGAAAAVDALLKHLLTAQDYDWNLLLLDKIPSRSATMPLLLESARSLSAHVESHASHESLSIPLTGTWEQFLASRSSRLRKTLRNISNRMERLGKVEVKRYIGKDIGEQPLATVFRISDASWKVSEGVAITSYEARKRFFEDLIDISKGDAGVLIWILEVNNRSIASEIQIRDDKTIYAVRSDYDQEYADSSPGSYLQAEILKNLFGGGFLEYNFGLGLNAYKVHWTDNRSSLVKFAMYNRRLYSRVLRMFDETNLTKLKELRVISALRELF
jgi:CelD/BcsL family acetyltransferase involved in cellulose biosynthesis